jgi:hypothetical protein
VVLNITIDRIEINIGATPGTLGRFGDGSTVVEPLALPAGIWEYDDEVCGCSLNCMWNS